MLRRAEWTDLSGKWEFAIDRDGSFHEPAQVSFDREIEVPFAVETQRSGIGDDAPISGCWYRLRWLPPALTPQQRLLLHFGAVDYAAAVYCDGELVTRHQGGYHPRYLKLPRRPAILGFGFVFTALRCSRTVVRSAPVLAKASPKPQTCRAGVP